MPDDTEMYTEEEMTLILREAAALADATPARIEASRGLSLEEIKAIAGEVGIDPAHVERAAYLIPRHSRESALERLIGGPIRHDRTVHFRTGLTEERATHLLSAARTLADQPGEGHADAFGMSWHTWSRFNRISVSAEVQGEGTSVRVRVDRGWSLFWTAFLGQLGIVLPVWMLAEAVDSYGALAALAVIPAGVLALARITWAASTRAVRNQVGDILKTLAGAVAESEPASASPEDRG